MAAVAEPLSPELVLICPELAVRALDAALDVPEVENNGFVRADEPLSPELVLVCPELARAVRTRDRIQSEGIQGFGERAPQHSNDAEWLVALRRLARDRPDMAPAAAVSPVRRLRRAARSAARTAALLAGVAPVAFAVVVFVGEPDLPDLPDLRDAARSHAEAVQHRFQVPAEARIRTTEKRARRVASRPDPHPVKNIATAGAGPPANKSRRPRNVYGVAVTSFDRLASFSWRAPNGVDHVILKRSPGRRRRPESVLYRGRHSYYTDRSIQAGIEYRYVIVSYDRRGRRSSGVSLCLRAPTQRPRSLADCVRRVAGRS